MAASIPAAPAVPSAVELLTVFVSALANPVDPDDVVTEALELAVTMLAAAAAALVVDDTVVASVGVSAGAAVAFRLAAEQRTTEVALPDYGDCHLAMGDADCVGDPLLIVVRRGEAGFSIEERNLVRGMSRVLALNFQAARNLAAERFSRADADLQAAEKAALLTVVQERQTLLERLTRIQRSINSRAPLPEVLQTIVVGASELLGDAIVGLRRIDPTDPDYAVILCSVGVEPGSSLLDRIRIGDGAGGRAISENRLVVIHDYATASDALPNFAHTQLQAAMGTPVHQNGVVAGSLVVASRQPGRRYSSVEQEILLSFADHVSLAITDATTTESLRRSLVDARYDALHDELTGLPNRALLRERLDHAWATASRTQAPIALLFLDFDDFKDINDSLGHDAGDRLLVTLAARFADILRPGDTVARLGGDEFAVLIENLAGLITAEAVAAHLLAVLAEPVALVGRDVTMRGSIGIAVSDFNQSDARSLLYSADLAMYEAKRRGGGRYVRYEPEMHEGTLERLDTEHALKIAITSDQLVLHYQPIQDLRSGRIVGAEALVRWQHPVRGLLGPIDFIPIAESSRLITGLGEWVLRAACAQAVQWPDDTEIAVNLSPRQIEPDLPQRVRDILAESGLSPDRLTLEVTESVAMADSAETLQIINELHAMGVHFAIDDFGTGHSSVARLRTLPVDQLKIDQSFVNSLDVDGGNAVLISAIVALSHGSGLVAVAEGVETPEQLRQLIELGCDRAQGYLLGRPTPACEFVTLLHARALVADAT
jgi:diguanylate cyclase (GGDEF)-like protein